MRARLRKHAFFERDLSGGRNQIKATAGFPQTQSGPTNRLNRGLMLSPPVPHTISMLHIALVFASYHLRERK